MALERDQVAQALPSYDMGEELGRGAWGVVLSAQHRRLWSLLSRANNYLEHSRLIRR